MDFPRWKEKRITSETDLKIVVRHVFSYFKHSIYIIANLNGLNSSYISNNLRLDDIDKIFTIFSGIPVAEKIGRQHETILQEIKEELTGLYT